MVYESQFANTYYDYIQYLLSPLCILSSSLSSSHLYMHCNALPFPMLCAVRYSVKRVPARRANLLPPKSLSGSVTGAMKNMPGDICTTVSVLVLPYSDFYCSLTVVRVVIGKFNTHAH